MYPEEQNNKKRDLAKGLSNYAKYSTMGFQMVAIIGIFTYIGYRIDVANNHEMKWVTASLALAGVFLSLYFIIRSLKK